MSITAEKDLVARLSTFAAFTATGAALHQGEPKIDAPTPWASLNVTEATPDVDDTINSSGTMVRYTVAVGIAAGRYADLRSLHAAVVAALDQFSGGQVVSCDWMSSDLSMVDEATTNRYGSVEFEVVGKEAAVLPTQSNTPVVEVKADGLYFAGSKVGATGPQGPPGATGPAGATGATGAQGPAGPLPAPPVTWTAPSAATVPLTLKGAVGQSADLFQCQTSAGTTVLAMSAPTGSEPIVWVKANTFNALGFRSNGVCQFAQPFTTPNQFATFGDADAFSGGVWRNLSNSYLLFNGGFLTTDMAAPRNTRVYGGDAAFPALTTHTKPGQTGNMVEFRDSSDNYRTAIHSSGDPILTSPNDTRYRLKVSDAGALSTVAV